MALCCHAAEPDKTVLVLGARAGDAERIGARGAEAYRSRGYRIVNSALAGSGLNLRCRAEPDRVQDYELIPETEHDDGRISYVHE
jgi:hypothetical protein